MPPHREFPARALSVLTGLCEQPSQWQDGIALARQTGLTPGDLHPILNELADRASSMRLGRMSCGRAARRESVPPDAEGLAKAAVALAVAAQRT